MLFLVTGQFPSAEAQVAADKALLEFSEKGSQETKNSSFKSLARIHLQQSLGWHRE